MGGKLSSNSNNTRHAEHGGLHHHHQHRGVTLAGAGDSSSSSSSGGDVDRNRMRARTYNELVLPNRSPFPVPYGLATTRYASEFGLASVSPPAERGGRRSRGRRNGDDSHTTNSLPSQLFSSFITGLKCPMCNTTVNSDDIETHLFECLTKPRISYNADVLSADAGECIICFEELCQGDTIARLPCFCTYHKTCIDEWFQRSRTCPEHPEQPTPPSPPSSPPPYSDAEETATPIAVAEEEEFPDLESSIDD
eukprot:gene19171-21092_t